MLAELPANPHPAVALAGPGRARRAASARCSAPSRPRARPCRSTARGTLVAVGARRRRGARRLAAARQALAAAPAAADRVPGRAPARDDGRRRGGLRGLALHRHRHARGRDRAGRAGPDPRVRRPARRAERRGARPPRRRRARAARRVRAPPHPRLLATLRGYVNPIPVAAEEHLSGGDVASVVVQYHDKRTLLMPREGADRGAHAPRAAGGAAPARARPARPRSASTARASARGRARTCSARGGVRALDEARVRRALWIGTPYFSRLPRLLAKGEIPTDARVGTIRTQGAAGGRGGRDGLALRVPRAPHRPRRAVQRAGPDLAPAGLAPARPLDAGRHVRAAGLRPRRGDELDRRPCPRRWRTTTGSRGRSRSTSRSATTPGASASRELADRLVAEEVARGAKIARAAARRRLYSGH